MIYVLSPMTTGGWLPCQGGRTAAVDEGEHAGANDRKPTLARLHVHDASLLASIVNVFGTPARMDSIGIMDHHHLDRL